MGEFLNEVSARIVLQGSNDDLKDKSAEFMMASLEAKYSYNFLWQGRPIIQYPQDIVAIQELIWAVKPDLVIETGIAHGGSLILSASLLALLDLCDAVDSKILLDPTVSHRKVIGVDIDIREHNRVAIESHPLASRIQMIEGSSVSTEVLHQVRQIADSHQRVMICLDSNHTQDHVLAELEAYGPLTSVGSYCVVFDTIIEDMDRDVFLDRPWGRGDNPKTAVRKFLTSHPEFEIDRDVQNKLLITVAPDGYLKRLS